MMSEQCSEVIGALALVQSEMPTITFDATNPHFKNRYATLAHILATVRPVLVKNGLAMTQLVTAEGALATVLLHKSGQWIRSDVPIIVDKGGPQAFGSAMSYARRYGVCGILAVAAEDDDDAEGATVRPAFQTRPPVAEKPLPKARNTNALPGEPPWFTEPLKFGKHKGKSWSDMAHGSLGGDRHQWLEWVSRQDVDANNALQVETRRRVVEVLKFYTERENAPADPF